MVNEFLWIGLLILTFVSILFMYKLFGRVGLYVFAGVSIVLANIQVLKTVQLFGMVATLGNIIYGASFLVTDILSEIYGKKESNKAVSIGFSIAIISSIIMYICTFFIPHETDFAHDSLATIFTILPRIMFASLIAYLISNKHDIWAFHFWKEKTNGKWLWFRNNMSTMTSQLLDTVIFSVIAFAGVFEWPIFLEILISTYIIKLITASLDTPFVYLARWMKKQGLVKEVIINE